MKPKKSQNADLENRKNFFFQIGLVIALALTMITMEWTTKPAIGSKNYNSASTYIQTEEIISIKREEEIKPQEKLRPIEIINIRPDDFELNENISFDMGADQSTSIDYRDYTIEPEQFGNEDPIIVEIMPTFNGGKPEIEFRRYISQNLQYPGIAAENYVQGRVVVKFVIDPNGRVVDAEVLSGVDPSLDREALRVIMSSPLWSPGIQGGKKVRVMFVFPIQFVLQ